MLSGEELGAAAAQRRARPPSGDDDQGEGRRAGDAKRRWTGTERRAAREARKAEAAAGAAEPQARHGGGGDEAAAAVAPAAARERQQRCEQQHVQQQQRRVGSHFGKGATTKVNDEWETCASAWAALLPLLEPRFGLRARVWQPFYYNGACAKHLRALGFTRVLHERGVDFFERARDAAFLRQVDFIWDNPPYTDSSTKEAVLRALVATGKPFCVLLPSSVLHTRLARDLLDPAALQVVVPRRVMVRKAGVEPVPFKFLVWLCHGLQLPRDLYLLDDAADGDGEGAAARRVNE